MIGRRRRSVKVLYTCEDHEGSGRGKPTRWQHERSKHLQHVLYRRGTLGSPCQEQASNGIIVNCESSETTASSRPYPAGPGRIFVFVSVGLHDGLCFDVKEKSRVSIAAWLEKGGKTRGWVRRRNRCVRLPSRTLLRKKLGGALGTGERGREEGIVSASVPLPYKLVLNAPEKSCRLLTAFGAEMVNLCEL